MALSHDLTPTYAHELKQWQQAQCVTHHNDTGLQIVDEMIKLRTLITPN